MLTNIAIMESSDDSSHLGTWTSEIALQQITCRANPDHQRGGRRIGLLSVDIPQTALSAEFVWTWQSDCLIRQDALDRLRTDRATGFETRPVRLIVNGVSIQHDYQEFVVTGWGGVARSDSGVKILESCSECGYLHYNGVTDWLKVFDPSQWDGADFFMVWPLPRFIFVSEKVTRLFGKIGFGGARLIPIEDLKIDSSGLSPGRVSYWLPDRRIEQLSIDSSIL